MMPNHIQAHAQPRYQFDTPVILAALLGDMIAAIDLTPSAEQPAMLAAAVADHGGSITPGAQPGRASNWGPHWWEISMLGVMGTGEDFPAALRQWTKCAGRIVAEAQAA